jgi:hypothetical protein
MRIVLALALLAAPQQGKERPAQGPGPEVGVAAPDFALKALEKGADGKDVEVKLSSFKGSKPVLLILGSYT